MSMKTFIWGGMFVGSGIGSVLPMLWSENTISLSSVILTFVGGCIGIWAGVQLGKALGV